jgi:tRNA threonylcarbamoyladenosine biosynthesis protein TsaB
MNILVIDTCYAACIVGVVKYRPSEHAGGLVGMDRGPRVKPEGQCVRMDRGQSEALMPMVQDVVADAGITLSDIGLIAVNVGPGSFTGVRVGIAAARGLAIGIGCDVQGVTSTDALYMARGNGMPARVAIDTRRGDYFVADYQTCADAPMDTAKICILDRYNNPAGDMSVILEADVLNDPRDYVAHVANLAAHIYANGVEGRRAVANPVYMRDAEVSTPKRP